MLKNIVDKLLKEHSRPLSWLAGQMDMTSEGLRLSLIKGSIKYNDLKRMSTVLDVPVSVFFSEHAPDSIASEDKVQYGGLKSELASCREVIEALKGQLKDKERIINLIAKSE